MAAKTVVVTGYCPIPGHPRSAAEYGKLGSALFGPLETAGAITVVPAYETVQDTWLFQLLRSKGEVPTHSQGDNPKKNTLAYHCVQHQKFAWLTHAVIKNREAETFIWIDYGIGHVPGVTPLVVHEFLAQVRDGDFAIPGCWPGVCNTVHDHFPCWRFCGGLMVVPRKQVFPLYNTIREVVKKNLEDAGNITWEVNSLARAEPSLPGLRWYQADHNQTMFTNYGVDLCKLVS
jgi:hypothetical protein